MNGAWCCSLQAERAGGTATGNGVHLSPLLPESRIYFGNWRWKQFSLLHGAGTLTRSAKPFKSSTGRRVSHSRPLKAVCTLHAKSPSWSLMCEPVVFVESGKVHGDRRCLRLWARAIPPCRWCCAFAVVYRRSLPESPPATPWRRGKRGAPSRTNHRDIERDKTQTWTG